MFEQSILRSTNGRKKWAIGVAILAEAVVVGVLVLIPLMYVQAIPTPDLVTELTLPPPPPAPPPPPPPAAVKVQKMAPRRFNPGELTAPQTVPKQTPLIAEASEPSLPEAPDPAAVPGGVPGGVAGGVIGGIIGAVPSPAPPPPPPAEKPAPAPERIHVGGAVQAAKLIHEVAPAYPKLAAEARIGGVVRMKAVIAKDGHIKDLTLISGHPLLVPAAMKAVKEWVYRPTYLNGQPTEVDTEIDVTFALST